MWDSYALILLLITLLVSHAYWRRLGRVFVVRKILVVYGYYGWTVNNPEISENNFWLD